MKINYRPEIDGLRALAVMSVIFYHAQIKIFGHQPFKGGFIGVDIFFVISGYLITLIILKELISTSKFSLKNFYERRIRRILPVLLFVILISTLFAWIYLLPNNLIEFSNTILSTLGFSSNYYFYYAEQQYESENGLLIPFLHTWSLSVEEQFYILFPIGLLIINKYIKNYLIFFLFLFFFASLGLSDWMSRNYPSISFYFLFTRIWELIAGSILAYFEIKFGRYNKKRILNNVLSIVGLLIIFLYIIFFKHYFPHPSLYTLAVIIGTCLIIWCSHNGNIVHILLSSKVFVSIGLISYSLYLWHYPILSFLRITKFVDENFTSITVVLLITFFFSTLSYKFIEKPSRNRKNNFNRIFLIIGIIYLFLILFFSAVIKNKGFSNRFPEYLTNSFITSTDLILEELGININSKNFSFSADKNKQNVVLLGDSHASTLVYDLWKNLDKDKYNFLTSIYGGCPFILNIYKVNKKSLKKVDDCDAKTQNERLEFVNQKNESIVILFGRLPSYLEEENFNNFEFGYIEDEWPNFFQNKVNSLESKNERKNYLIFNYKETIKKILEQNHKIILVYPMPETAIPVPDILYKNFKFNKFKELFKNKYLSTSYDIYKIRTQSSFEFFDSLQHNNIYRVFPDKLFCDNFLKDRCVTHDNKDIFYRDDDHPSLKGSKLINELILEKIEIIK